MKKILKIFILFIAFIVGIYTVNAEEKNLVNIYLFHSNTCPHCQEEIGVLEELQKKYQNIKIYKYEISEKDNYDLLEEVATLYDTKINGVPFTVIGDKYYIGFSHDNGKATFIATIEYYSDNGYKDRVGEHLGNVPLPTYEIKEDQEDVDDYTKERTEYKISILGHQIKLKNLTLPVISILIGLVDGFNPCAMWVLLFLISVLIGMKDRRRMWTLGITFLLTSALIYLVFMLAWLNAATFLLSVKWFRLIIGLIALIGAVINLRSYIRHRKDNGCDVIDDKKRNKIFDKIKKFTHEKNFILAILGAMALAISVNIIELACSAGLPVMFIEILSMNNLNTLEHIIYIALYMFSFLLDDLIVFFIAMRTMELTGFSTKYGKVSKLVGGLLLLVIGILLMFKPEWLMFNF